MSSQFVRRFILAFLTLLPAALSTRADEVVTAAPRTLRVRMEWGSTTPKTWNGVVELSSGRFDRPESLGVEADEPGTIWLEGGAVWFRRRSPRIYDGFDVSVTAPDDAKLNVTLQSDGADSVREQFSIAVSEIGSPAKTLGEERQPIRLIVRRTPGDNLPVRVAKPHLIYAPRERFDADVTVESQLQSADDLDCELSWQLCPARSKKVLNRQSSPVKFDIGTSPMKQVPVSIPLPEDEGAYDIHIVEWHDGREHNRRTVQVLVLEDQRNDSPFSHNDAEPKLVDSFRPDDRHLFRHVAAKSNRQAIGDAFSHLFSLLPGTQSGTAGEADTTRVRWDAYKLRVDHPGRPHRLTVVARAADAQNLGISLLEPNAAGQLMPVGVDSGLYVRRDSTTSEEVTDLNTLGSTISHELIVWPKIREPILFLHDMATGTPIGVERVELHEYNSLPRATSIVDNPASATPRRLVGPSMHAPLLPENFGASEAFDAQSGRSLDDWATFHAAATRAAEYLHFAGCNSLLLAACADGSTIYPSPLLQPTPRYDTGVFFSSGQDPLRKDVLELMFRVFDRERLTLIPLMQFSTPLPSLERAITDDGSRSVGIELIGRDGRSWRETRRSARGLAPYYNPLNPQVQQAVMDVVAELADRYHGHASFAGVAVELASTSYLQLPGLEWGYDDETIASFQKAAGIQFPMGDGADRFQKRYDLLTTTHLAAWNRWRCEEIARFHRRLADVVTAYHPRAQLILAGKDLLSGTNADAELDEARRSGQKLDQLLISMGLDFKLNAEAKHIMLLRPALWRAPEKALSLAADDALNYSPQLNSMLSNCRQGSLFFCWPRECRVNDFDAVSPWQPACTWLATQASVAGVENCRRYALSLAAADTQMIFDGGWSLPMGQEQATIGFRKAVAQLPAVQFHLCKVQQQPVTVRMARHEGATWIYAVNAVAHPVEVHLELSCGVHVAAHCLLNHEIVALAGREGGHSSTHFPLEPYGIWACRLEDANVTIDTVKAALPKDALTEMETRIKGFDEQLTSMRNDSQTAAAAVANSGFEEPSGGDGSLPGWELPVQNAANWTLDGENPRSGNSSLRLAAAGDNVAALSSPLAVDDSRRLTISAWLRSDQDAADVRLVFSAAVDKQPHVRHVPVTVDKEWRHYVFQVNDIPEKLDSAAVKIEMRGPGKLWIDDVDVGRSRVSRDDLRQLTKVSSAVSIAWDEGRYADCERLLDGYWGRLPFDEVRPTRKLEPSRTAEGWRNLFRRQ